MLTLAESQTIIVVTFNGAENARVDTKSKCERKGFTRWGKSKLLKPS